MKNFITAFFMCWGNFLTLPCPYKKWDGALKNLMLAMLPSVGAVVGILWVLLAWVLAQFNIPPLIMAFLMVYFVFKSSGFMHLDGYMDVSDAIMSRRPLEDRKRILKDSTVGAFAVVMAIFLIGAWIASMGVFLANAGGSSWKLLFMIPVTSRAAASAWVLTYTPMDTSQYRDDAKKKGRGGCKAASVVQFLIWLTATAAAYGWSYIPELAIVTAVGIVSSYIICRYARKQLDGMNGDIAGASICTSEIISIIVLASIEGGAVLPL